MKTIGLLGGTSWPSTMEYYRQLNEMAQDELGGHHSANILLKSIDYHAIKSLYHQGWDEIPALLRAEIEELAALKPDCIVLCNNTLHRALDNFLPQTDLEIPVIHIVDVTAKYLQQEKLQKVLLLGTKFTMEDGYYASKLQESGVEVTIPTLPERDRIQEAQSRLARGEVLEKDRTFFRELLDRYGHLDAAVLACTELPLAITPDNSALRLDNPTELQCNEAFRFATHDMATQHDVVARKELRR